MFRLLFLAVAVNAAIELLPELPEPGDLALHLSEDDFEDYLDKWIDLEQRKRMNYTASDATVRSGCSLRVNGDFAQPQPVFIRRSTNAYLHPFDNSGIVRLISGEQVIVGCPGRTIVHPRAVTTTATATIQCSSGTQITGPGFIDGRGAFNQLTCNNHAFHEAQETSRRCYNNNVVIRVGFIVNKVFHTVYNSCFDKQRFEVLYVWMPMDASNAVHQSGVTRPSWIAGNFFPGVGANNLYTQVQQKQAIARVVGEELANRYVTTTQFLARGHLVAKSDTVFAPEQRSTFYFINAVPQWQPFNAGNWNWLEQNLRARIGAVGYNCIIYTGSFGVTQLRNQNGRFVDIYLDNTNGNRRLPVPLYMYKVAYDASRRVGTAFISINNPHYTLAEARALQFCTDRCRNNNSFSWLRWQPDRVDLGYSFCCTLADFRRVVPHLPAFNVNGLLA
ncbi:uncharacterized protein LOC125061285 [Pieris napi]|uniref:uncharacterized protein LOC125061285 n=1 Tax=Pieris napi TaxID=78633 RepID=UPI001FBA7791|nr:uncharacterized protein LOC125061285 [Pieris napi]